MVGVAPVGLEQDQDEGEVEENPPVDVDRTGCWA